MKGIIFAAGIGSRLKPFTDKHPKALAEICGKPLLGHVIDKMLYAGIDGLVVNVHHFHKQVTDYIDVTYPGCNIEISDESNLLLDTGGALAKIGRFSRIINSADDDEIVVVHNADILTDFPLVPMIDSLGKNTFSSILVDYTRNSSRKLLFDGNNRLRGWINRASGAVRPDGLIATMYSEAAFGGVHAMPVSSIKKIASWAPSEIRPFSIIDYYIGHADIEEIMAYVPAGPYRWHDIGTPEKLEAARLCFT